ILSSALPKPYRKLWGPESERVTVCICTPSFPQSSTTTSACPPNTAAPVSAVDESVARASVGTKTVRSCLSPGPSIEIAGRVPSCTAKFSPASTSVGLSLTPAGALRLTAEGTTSLTKSTTSLAWSSLSAMAGGAPTSRAAVASTPVAVRSAFFCILRSLSSYPLVGLHLGMSGPRSEEHTSELQSRFDLVCRLLLEKKNYIIVCQ